jgi:hypothetical protein
MLQERKYLGTFHGNYLEILRPLATGVPGLLALV